MKRCIATHTVEAFGTIPEGSLWDDDSLYVTDPALFEDVDAEPKPKPAKKPARKFGAPKPVEVTEEGDADGDPVLA